MLQILLPERRRLAGDATQAPQLLRAVARGDTVTATAGDDALVTSAFDILPRGLPVAALTRQHDANDATLNTWLRADPGHVRADLGVGRLLALGDMGLSPEEADALLRPLRPLFGDEGFPISAPVPDRWYLMLPREARLPAFAGPDQVLGDDLYSHLPQGEPGRRWRRLLNEAQVILHNHPVNAQRLAQGRLPVNTLWFWGAGTVPDAVRAAWTRVVSGEVLLQALAGLAGIPVEAPSDATCIDAGTLLDLRDARDLPALERDWIAPLLTRQRRGDLATLELAFTDGLRVTVRANHRWRFWRKTPAALS